MFFCVLQPKAVELQQKSMNNSHKICVVLLGAILQCVLWLIYPWQTWLRAPV